MNKAFITGTTLPLLLPIPPQTAAAIGCLYKITSPSASTVDLKNDLPVIFHNAGSAIVLIVQGDSVLSPILKTDPRFVVNTTRDLFYDKASIYP